MERRPAARCSRSAGHADQRIEPLWRPEQLAAGASKDDRPAIEDDRLLGQLQRQPGVLLDQQQRQIVFVFEPVEAGQQGVDDNRGETFERLVHQ